MVMDMMAQGAPPPAPAAPPPDLAAALGVGGPGAPPPGGPDLAGALGAPADQNTPSAPSGQGDPVDLVNQMLELAKSYLDTEQEHEDLLAMQKITTELQALLAKDQQDADKAMQGNSTPRILRKAFSQ